MLEVFKDAITLMISAGKRMIDSALNQAEVLLKVRNLLLEVKRRNKKVHTIGMGRSGLAGKFFAELLKLRRIKASTIGDTLAKPVDSGDVVFAFSGSGWTTTTTLYSELCLRRGAILIALTATKGSKLDRLADYTIYLLGKPVLAATDYIARKIAGRYKTPLAPMGSIPEFSALLVSAGIAAGTNAPHIDKRKALETQSLFNGVGKPLVIARTPGHVGRPGRGNHRAGVHGPVKLIEKAGSHRSIVGGGCRELAPGHAEVEVVQYQKGDIEVAAAGGKQVGATDTEPPVAHGDNDMQFGTGHLESGGIGKGASVQAVHGMGVEEGIKQAGAADITDHHDLLTLQAHI